MAERKLTYESLHHKAEGGFLVKAPSLERLYIDAALALTDQWVKLDLILEDHKRALTVKGATREILMVAWLNELMQLFVNHRFISKRITFQKFDGKEIHASLFGEVYTPLKHGTVLRFKAVTEPQVQLGEIHAAELQFFARIGLIAEAKK